MAGRRSGTGGPAARADVPPPPARCGHPGPAPAAPPPAPAAPPGPVHDLRGRPCGDLPTGLLFAPRDLVVVAGLPGSGKSTLMHRVAGTCVDSQDARERWARRLPSRLPYGAYRPLVRLAHYRALWRVLRGGTGAVVHDCGAQPWVRRWIAREARRRGGRLHLLVLDVAPGVARQGQRQRGRKVSRYAFARHRRAVRGLLASLESARLPAGCASAVLLDRAAADALEAIVLAQAPATARARRADRVHGPVRGSAAWPAGPAARPGERAPHAGARAAADSPDGSPPWRL